MTRQELIEQIKIKKSYLCVGLDTDINKIPKHLLAFEDPIFEFNKAIIDATAPYAVAYKPNIAFYESMGSSGWESLRKTYDYIPKNCFTIADAKRGDIGNTSDMYAKTFFDPTAGAKLDFDAVTVAPYMGSDSVTPFLKYKGKWVVLLALTSNEGSKDFQWHGVKDLVAPLFESVLTTSQNWGTDENMMYVVGATRAEQLYDIRQIVRNHFLLIPGVGAQGGSLELVSQCGMNRDCGLLVNNSRAIIYASSGKDFAEAAASEAAKMQEEMSSLLYHFSAVLR